MRLWLAPGHTSGSSWTSSLHFRGPMKPRGGKTRVRCLEKDSGVLERRHHPEPTSRLLAPVESDISPRQEPSWSGKKTWSKNEGNVFQINSSHPPTPQIKENPDIGTRSPFIRCFLPQGNPRLGWPYDPSEAFAGWHQGVTPGRTEKTPLPTCLKLSDSKQTLPCSNLVASSLLRA